MANYVPYLENGICSGKTESLIMCKINSKNFIYEKQHT